MLKLFFFNAAECISELDACENKLTITVNLEILATKIFSVSSIDILVNINFSDLVLGNFSSNFIIIVMVGSSLLAVQLCFFYLLAAEVDASPTGRSGELCYSSAKER